MLHKLAVIMLIICATSAVAQDNSAPLPIGIGQLVKGQAGAVSGPVGCYAVAPPAGQNLTVTAEAGFSGKVHIARGALCHANALQASTDLTPAAAATVSLRAAGGRYLILVERTSGAARQFALTVTNGASVVRQADNAPAIAAGAATEPLPTPDVTAPLPNSQPSARKALMLAQVEQRRIALAEAEEKRRAAAAEAARREEQARMDAMRREAEIAQANANRPDNTAMYIGAFLQGFNNGTQQANESARMVENTNRQIRAMEVDYRARQDADRAAAAAATARTAEQRRIANENLRAAQVRAAEAQRASTNAAAAANGRATTNNLALRRTSPSAPTGQSSAAETYYMPEALAYCTDTDPNSQKGMVYCQTDFMQGSTGYLPNDRSFLNSNPNGCIATLRATRPDIPGTQRRVYSCGIAWQAVTRRERSLLTGVQDANLRRIYICTGTALKCATPPQPER